MHGLSKTFAIVDFFLLFLCTGRGFQGPLALLARTGAVRVQMQGHDGLEQDGGQFEFFISGCYVSLSFGYGLSFLVACDSPWL